MTLQKALRKVQQVFLTAQTDTEFRERLTKNPRQALADLDLTRLEILTILDIVDETQKSGLAEKLEELRGSWQKIRGPKK
jgi:hypothetical protein